MIGGKIKCDADTEGDRHPRHQAAGAGLGDNPFPQLGCERRPGPKARRHKAAGLRRTRLRPRAGIAAAALRPPPLCHAVTPRTRPMIQVWTTMLAYGLRLRIAERMQNHASAGC